MSDFSSKLIRKLKNILAIDIVKVFSLTAISTVVKMLTGFVSIKVVAVILGPDGLALMGQLSSFVAIALSFASVGINTGVTKYVAEFGSNKLVLRELLSTAYKLTLVGSLFIGIVIICIHSLLGEYLLKTSEYNYVFIIFGITIIFYAVNNLLISIVNGFKGFKDYVRINIANSILGLVYTVILVLTMGLDGAMISFVTYQSISLVITIYILRKLDWFCWDNFKAKFSKSIASKYSHYSLMLLVTTITVPVGQIILRNYVIVNISEVDAGLWEAMNRLSAMYLIVITSSLSVYYLPRLSELKSKQELRSEIIKAYKFIIPMLVLMIVPVYLLRFFIIKILFTPEFYPMESLFSWQLLGDFFKITSWLLAFLFVAKSKTFAFVTIELLFTSGYVLLALWFININGLEGIVQAYLVNYVCYLMLMLILFRKLLWR